MKKAEAFRPANFGAGHAAVTRRVTGLELSLHGEGLTLRAAHPGQIETLDYPTTKSPRGKNMPSKRRAQMPLPVVAESLIVDDV